MIDTSVVRVHQPGACILDNNHQDMGRSRGGPDEQDSRGRGHQWLAGLSRPHARRGARQSAVFGSPQRVAPTNYVTRGSRIRRGLDQGACPPARGMGEHSAETQPQRPDLLQPVSVSRAKLDRTVFNKIKQCRRVATRYDKLAANYLAFIKLAAIRIWLRANESTALKIILGRYHPPCEQREQRGHFPPGCCRPAVLMAQWVILRRWETIALVRAPVRDCPDLQRHPIRMRPGR
jgi:hypothetical protein